MKKLVLLLGLSSFIFANTLPQDLVCKKVKKSDIEKIMQTKYKIVRVGKLPINPPYDLSFCEYTNRVLPDISIYYYYKSSAKVYPLDSKVEELKNLDFLARVVYNDNGEVFEIIGDTKEGSKIVFVFRKEIKKDSKKYKEALKLLKKLVKEFK